MRVIDNTVARAAREPHACGHPIRQLWETGSFRSERKAFRREMKRFANAPCETLAKQNASLAKR
jgi:hypothetical protein